MKQYKTNFTLIELLVVIGIIAILASILLPALQKARKTALRSLCASNQKQIGVSFGMYNMDYDGAYPKASLNEWGNYWSNILYATTNGKDLVPDGFDSDGFAKFKHGPKSTTSDYLGFCSKGNLYEEGTIFHCPSQHISPLSNDPEYPISYAMTKLLGGEGKFNGYRNMTLPYLRVRNLAYPSVSCLVLEGGMLFADNWDWSNSIIPKGFFPANNWLHNKGLNVLFVDGHSEYRKITEIPPNRNSTDNRLFWQGVKQ